MYSASGHKLRTSFRKQKVIGPLHTNGPFAATSDGRRIVTCVNEEAILTDVGTGAEICRFKGDDTQITALGISPSDNHLLIFYSSLFFRIYDLPSPSSSVDDDDVEASVGASRVLWTRQIARAHDAPVHVITIDPTSCYAASGAADGHVKIWDITRGFVTHSFRGHAGVVSALHFHFPKINAATKYLVTGSVDTKIRIFDLTVKSDQPFAVLEGHVSVPRGVSVSEDGRWLVSGGRDTVLLLWDLQDIDASLVTGTTGKKKKAGTGKYTPKLANTIPVLERIEAVGILEGSGRLKAFTAGEKGEVKIWDVFKSEVVVGGTGNSHRPHAELSEDMKEQTQIVNAVYLPRAQAIVTVHGDQNILFHSSIDGSLLRQIIGFNDEIIDAAFLSSEVSSSPSSSSSMRDTHFAIATNSSQIRVYSTTSLDARLLDSHKDMVLCLDKSPAGTVLASGSKDKSARIWAPSSADDTSTSNVAWRCVAVCEGHTESVGAVALSRRPFQATTVTTQGKNEPGERLRFIFTGSQDRTVKLWDLSSIPPSFDSSSSEPIKAKSLLTQIAHEKDINSLDVSPNDKLLVTGSQDKTAKIWEIHHTAANTEKKKAAKGELKLLGTLKGHKRGIWNVRFSRFDRIVATASGDKTVKLWSLENYSCIKTFEGHTNSILRVEFLNRGMQLVTAAADGLVKLWNIKDEGCLASLDNHEDKVWALAISSDEKTVVSAAADSVITFWQDCTELEEEEKQNAKTELVLKEQDFVNYVSLHDYRNAILLALSMDQPGRLFNLFNALRSQRTGPDNSTDRSQSITGNSSVDQVIKTLPLMELARLLRHVRNWNANNKSYTVAQTVLHAILKYRSATDVLKAFRGGNAIKVLAEIQDNGDEDGDMTAASSKEKDMRALKELLDGLIPYTERHLARAEKMVQDSYIVDLVLNEMGSGVIFNGDAEMVGVEAQ
ncbi:U3 small nucleolar RNA-associated protein 13 [Tulasnella sp. JGI-2019a]|nr:U3 small nucleolar RNA-associated protein 13 [Tulasnella sp. JGI-2019a]KAG9011195.1 U3 small nucleolar RNA-associated protein 13 [Tulasnella sp. JGI-2019a]KAG9035361.1 U3 small nucleolar RNA-associated protein 13 [Tulasnella sp. JGI-2019a]